MVSEPDETVSHYNLLKKSLSAGITANELHQRWEPPPYDLQKIISDATIDKKATS